MFRVTRHFNSVLGKSMIQSKIIQRIHNLGIDELKSIQSLNELNGDLINLECRLPNGRTGKILDDKAKYYGIQVERKGDDRCYGVAADANQIAIFD